MKSSLAFQTGDEIGEFEFKRQHFARIAELLRAESGIHLAPEKQTLVYSRLAKRLRVLGLRSFEDYCRLVESERGGPERGEMLSALTTNVTRFFREPHHFEHLQQRMLPNLAQAARRGARVRFWSAACSTGEEPYSIAICVLEAFPDASSHDVRILATDIDPHVIATGQRGLYSQEAVSELPVKARKWFSSAQSGGAMIADDLKALVRFRQLNLNGVWPMRGLFDVIFCRNVVIYFDDQTQKALWARFHQVLTPQGRLYIGHSERVDHPGFISDGQTIYRLDGRAA